MKNNRKNSYTHNLYNSLVYKTDSKTSSQIETDINIYQPVKRHYRKINYDNWTKMFRQKLNTLKTIRPSSSLNRTHNLRESSYNQKLKTKINSMLISKVKDTDRTSQTQDKFFLRKKRNSNKQDIDKSRNKLKVKEFNTKSHCLYDLFETDERPSTPNFKQIEKEKDDNNTFLSENTQESPSHIKTSISNKNKVSRLSKGLEQYKSINSGRSICLYRGTRMK